MSELSRIIAGHEQAERQGERAVLATVVNTEGSVYRRPGARMLVRFDASGTPQTTGAISGCCLEAAVCERAAEVLRTGVLALITYDTTSDEEIVWGFVGLWYGLQWRHQGADRITRQPDRQSLRVPRCV